jgi:hypothetical protein
MLRRKPENVRIGRNVAPMRAIELSKFGVIIERNVAKPTAAFAVRTTVNAITR